LVYVNRYKVTIVVSLATLAWSPLHLLWVFHCSHVLKSKSLHLHMDWRYLASP
jgi:hypothetical protein